MKFFGRLIASALIVTASVAVPVFAVDANNFVISDYGIDAKLSTDGEGRSVLTTVETITVEFPEYDQNHGIERAIPKQYDGHTTSVKVASVTDERGGALEYTLYDDDNGNLVVRVGDANTYVRGTQVYQLTYTQRDITKYFANTNDDELYLDTNGVDWRVPIQKLSTRVTIDDALLSEQTGQTACYWGYEGSSDICQVTQDGAVVANETVGLQPGQNVTIVIGFKPQTFTPYQPTLWEQIVQWWSFAQLVTLLPAVGVLVWLSMSYHRALDRRNELHPVAPEYLPPSDTSVTTSARIRHALSTKTMTAQLLDLAVRHYIRLYETRAKALFRAAEYEVEVVKDVSTLLPEELELLHDMFGNTPTVGSKLNLKKLRKPTYKFYERLSDNDRKIDGRIEGEYGLRNVDTSVRARFLRYARVLSICGVVLIGSIPLLVTSLVALIMAYALRPLTDEGLALSRYLEGLAMYIGVAEKERIAMLQSPEGAEKITSVAKGTDQKSLIKLYERVLPYAVLFGQEKQWTKQLGTYYEQVNAQPDWYSGQAGVFNALTFSSAMAHIGQTVSYATSSNSNSGGVGGGGFSGGGGGGGGGGGW